MSIHDLNYWTNLKTTDEILDSYENAKRSILDSNIEEYSKVISKYIPVDPNCMMRKGYVEYQCGNCLLLDRLGITTTGIINLETGRHRGRRLILKEIPSTNISLKYDGSNKLLLTNEFTQRLLATWLLQTLNIPVLEIYTGFICGKTGYLLYQLPDTVVEGSGKEGAGKEGPGKEGAGKEGAGKEVADLIEKLNQLEFRYESKEDLFYRVGNEIKFRVPGYCKFKLPTGVVVRNFNYVGGCKLSSTFKNGEVPQ